MTTTPTPESVYEQVWRPMVEQDGELRLQTIKEILFDYGALLSDTSMLYTYLTEGKITNPQDPVDDVIELADELAAASIDLGIRTVLNYLLSELDVVASDPPETRLEHLITVINTLYEQG